MFYVVKPLDVDTEPKVFFTPKAAQEYKQERERIGGHGPIVSATGFPSCSVSQKFRQLGDVPAIRRASSRVYHKPKSLYSKGWSMKFPKTALIAGSLLFILAARISAEGLGVLGQGNASCSSWLENHTSNDALSSLSPRSGRLLVSRG